MLNHQIQHICKYPDIYNGYSIVKHVRDYKLSRKVENCEVYVKSFSGAKVMCMEDYVKPTLTEMPTHIIFHVGTNDVPTKKSPEH